MRLLTGNEWYKVGAWLRINRRAVAKCVDPSDVWLLARDGRKGTPDNHETVPCLTGVKGLDVGHIQEAARFSRIDLPGKGVKLGAD